MQNYRKTLIAPFPLHPYSAKKQMGEDQRLPTKARILFLNVGEGEQAPSAVSFKKRYAVQTNADQMACQAQAGM